MSHRIPLTAALVLALAACAGDADDRAAAGTDTMPAAPPPAATEMPGSGMLDPDAASEAELVSAGLDSATAAAVVAGRPYADMRAVDAVLARTLGEAERDSAYTRIWKPIALNSATAEEIELIPGVGARMRHEFEEYRPYASIEQFRREIGKYVDSTEVARLERYVEVR
jgi:DNA uptake protein ComE-like DNA-binding protein